MKTLRTIFLASVASLVVAGPASAQGMGTGPVAQRCAEEIKKFCATKQHGSGEVRACLESKKAEASAACKQALETTGGGREERP